MAPHHGLEKQRYGPLYIHFNEQCLQNYDCDHYYGPGDPFTWEKIKIDAKTKSMLKDAEAKFLHDLGIN